MNSLITQCPNCQTAFRINAAQLSAAEGNVRCGACLQVFMAEENLLDIAPGDTAFFDAGQSDIDSEYEHDPDLELSEPPVESSSRWELIDESTETETETETEVDTEFEIEAATEIDNEIDADYRHEDLIDLTPANEYNTDSPHQQQMLLDDDFADMSDGRAEPSLFSARRAALDADLHDEEEPVRFSDDNRAALRSVDAPVELNSHFRLKVSAVRLAGQGFLFLFLAACLALQLVWFNRDTLSMQAEWRPRLALMCSVFGCTVPPQRDLTAIVSDSLAVRSHPETRGALLVNLSFSNQAAFAQPFPALTLRFTDAQEQIVASRRFLPGEYLQEDLRTMNLMPPGTSVQAQLDIVDPGANAINYEVFLGNPD